MSIPIRCFTCGKVTGNNWENYLQKIKEGKEEMVAVKEMGYTRYCCARMFISNVDVNKIYLKYPTIGSQNENSLSAELKEMKINTYNENDNVD